MNLQPISGVELQIRVSDCDSFGHVNNAVYVAFIQHALALTLTGRWTDGDWKGDSPYRWALMSMHVEYHQTAVPGDRLAANLWLVESNGLSPVFGCEIIRLDQKTGDDADQTLVRSQTSWERISCQSGQAVPIPERMLAGFPKAGGRLPRTFKPVEVPRDLARYHWDHTVMRSESGPDGHVHPQAVYHWIEEGIFNASAQAGWPVQRMQEAGFLVYTIRHDTEFSALPVLGDRIAMTNRLIDIRRLKGTWLNEIRRESDNALLARNYATGAFLDLEGRPATPPDGIMDSIQFGR